MTNLIYFIIYLDMAPKGYCDLKHIMSEGFDMNIHYGFPSEFILDNQLM